MTERSIAAEVARVIAARNAPPLRRPFTDSEWAVISEHGRAAVDVELRRIEKLLQDDGFYRSGFTAGHYPPVDPFEGCDRDVASPDAPAQINAPAAPAPAQTDLFGREA